MRKNTITLIMLIAICIFYTENILAKKVSKKDVQKVASNFIDNKNVINNYSTRKTVIGLDRIDVINSPQTQEILAYVVNLTPKGFVIISTDTDLKPIISYSFRHNWNTDTGINNIFYQMLLKDMKLRKQNFNSISEDIKEKNNSIWQKTIQEGLSKSESYSFRQWPEEGTTSTGGWIETTWVQHAPYNNFCPLDPDDGNRSIVGCVATAMSQVVNYHEYIGNLQFNVDDKYSAWGINIDTDSSLLDFPSFKTLNNYLETIKIKYDNNQPLNDVDKAALNFACGISVKMCYSSSKSSSALANIVETLTRKFGFNSAEYVDWDDAIHNKLKNNIMNGLPAILGISAIGGIGHAIISDGYNTDGFFHFNFGWGESKPNVITDAWYKIPENMGAEYNIIETATINILSRSTTQNELVSDVNSLYFPGRIGEESEIKEVILKNTGASPINIQDITVSDNFLISTNNITFDDSIDSMTIASNEEITVYIKCRFESAITFKGDVTISYSDNKFLVVDLVGYGLPEYGTIVDDSTVSGVWNKMDSPYFICRDISIEKGCRLNMLPGTKVCFLGQYKFEIGRNAKISARGSEQDSILFNARDKEKGWFGIDFILSDDDDTLSYCVITDGNAFGTQWRNCGGALYIYCSSPLIKHSKITKNTAFMGGAIYADNSEFKISDSNIEQNRAEFGGALNFDKSSPKIENTLICKNFSAEGGILYSNQSSPIFLNVTVCNNQGGLTCSDNGLFCIKEQNNVTFKNSILWANDPGAGSFIYFSNSIEHPNVLEFQYSDIDTNYSVWAQWKIPGSSEIRWEHGNITADPIFKDILSSDYTIENGSPCVDAGDPNDMVGDEPFPHGYRINMGAYGGTINAATTPNTRLTLAPNPVDFEDVLVYQQKELTLYLKNGSPGTINITDILLSDSTYFSLEDFPGGNILSGEGLVLEAGSVDSILVKFASNLFIDKLYTSWLTVKSDELPDQTIQLSAKVLVGTKIEDSLVSGIWSKSNSPYHVYCDISIPVGETLIIEPGVIIRFMGQYSFNIGKKGQLRARGNINDIITFCAFDTSLGWFGIDFKYSGNDDTLSYCLIKDRKCIEVNSDHYYQGAALYLYYSSPTITHSILKKNQGVNGGAIYCYGSSPKIMDCRIEKNLASVGGGMSISRSNPTIGKTLFIKNEANTGGAIHTAISEILLVNVTLSENIAHDKGGGIHLWGESKAIIKNSIIGGNESLFGKNIAFCNRIEYEYPQSIDFTYSDIDTSDTNWIHRDIPDIGEIIWGTGNIVEEPLFMNAANNDFTLQPSSPCVDAGDPNPAYNDLENPENPEFALWPAMGTLRNDMGAYGGFLYQFPVPVELSIFEAKLMDNFVLLKWETITESNNYGFDVERSHNGQPFEKISFIKGIGTTTKHNSYLYQDTNLNKDLYLYRLKQIDTDGKFHYSKTISVSLDLPATFSLSQNYPNPFNPETVIEYQLPKMTSVKIEIYNVIGELVATLVDKKQDAGYYKVNWNGINQYGLQVTSGIYFCRFKSDNFTKIRKMILVR